MSDRNHALGPERLELAEASLPPQVNAVNNNASLDPSGTPSADIYERILKAEFTDLDKGDSVAAGFVGGLVSDFDELEKVVMHYSWDDLAVSAGKATFEATLTASNQTTGASSVTATGQTPTLDPSSSPSGNLARYQSDAELDRCDGLSGFASVGDILIFEAYLFITSNQDGTDGNFRRWRVNSIELIG